MTTPSALEESVSSSEVDSRESPMPQPQKNRHRRLRKLVHPPLQWRLAISFVATAAIALLVQFTLLGARLLSLSNHLPTGGDYLAEALPGLLLGVLGFSFGILLPAACGIGILITFRVAGPVFSMERQLRRIASGESQAPCRIRKNDELQELCTLINEALDAERARVGRDPVAESKAA